MPESRLRETLAEINRPSATCAALTVQTTYHHRCVLFSRLTCLLPSAGCLCIHSHSAKEGQASAGEVPVRGGKLADIRQAEEHSCELAYNAIEMHSAWQLRDAIHFRSGREVARATM